MTADGAAAKKDADADAENPTAAARHRHAATLRALDRLFAAKISDKLRAIWQPIHFK